MVIEYLIARDDGKQIVAGTFDSSDREAQRRFAARAKEAWADGHAVITKAADQPGSRGEVS